MMEHTTRIVEHLNTCPTSTLRPTSSARACLALCLTRTEGRGDSARDLERSNSLVEACQLSHRAAKPLCESPQDSISKVYEVIKDSITDEEQTGPGAHLSLERGTKLKFTFWAFRRYIIDEAKQEPSFVAKDLAKQISSAVCI
jgi:hypothetical protein